MKRLFTLISLIFITNMAFSQLKIKEGSFKKVEGCVILDKNDHYDSDNMPMALIRIYTEYITPEQKREFAFHSDFNTELDVSLAETGEIELYASYQVKKVKITHSYFSPIELVMPFDLVGFQCYEVIIQGPKDSPAPEPVIQKQYLIVKADQPDALIYIDDEPLSTSEASKLVDAGTSHTYKIECNLYHTETGSVTVNERTTIEKRLRPNFGYINVTTSPESGAKVFVDGVYVGVSPVKTDKLGSGSHKVRVMKDMFKMTEQSFTVADGQTTNANINMSANFVNVTVDADSGVDIYVDDEYKGKGRWTGRLSDGPHIFEARMANHKSTRKSVELVLGETKTISLEKPTPIYGSLDINSSPMNANIYIDGKQYGQTPNYINDILIGSHELRLEKTGCATLTKTITVKEGETLSLNETLQTGREITISTDQNGDRIYVDDKYIGTSPITSNLSYGSHQIKAERNGESVTQTINVTQYGGDDKVVLAFGGNQTFTVNGVSFTMIAVEGGTFRMGATSEQGSDAYDDEKLVHSVTLSDYYIGETEVTQELWEAVMGSNPSDSKGDQKPVESVSWNDCQEFIRKLNALTGKNFRLPTEAEWEYAARGGNKSRGYKYSGSNSINNVAWYYENSGDSRLDDDSWDYDKLESNNCRTHNVKSKSPNELGIYDMSGNVYEWCQDWYGDYSSSSQTNPQGPSSGSDRVLRGGSWISFARSCRVSYRYYNNSDYRFDNYGLRLSFS